MSVYTYVSQSELAEFLQNYESGELIKYEGITAGIENTNYFVDTTQGRYVLTLFETLKTDELPFYLQLMAFLNEHDIPSAHPVADKTHNYVRQLKGKPAALMQRLQGKSVLDPGVSHCEAIGEALAKLHVAGQSFQLKQENFRGANWRNQTARQLLPLLAPDDKDVLQNEVLVQNRQHYSDLPQGVIHADLFRDNALFVDAELSGVLDFYFACNDCLIYDVAISVNDWCVQPGGALDFARASGLCRAYQANRPLTAKERKAWPIVLRLAALRFWLSRLWDFQFPKAGEMTFQKDPDEFKQILRMRIAEAADLETLWLD
jgi:homoserine kinase type II